MTVRPSTTMSEGITYHYTPNLEDAATQQEYTRMITNCTPLKMSRYLKDSKLLAHLIIEYAHPTSAEAREIVVIKFREDGEDVNEEEMSLRENPFRLVIHREMPEGERPSWQVIPSDDPNKDPFSDCFFE